MNKENLIEMTDLQDIASLPDVAGPSSDQSDAAIKVKAPKRILHFSDGTMEEFSEDEEDTIDAKNKNTERSISVVSSNQIFQFRMKFQ